MLRYVFFLSTFMTGAIAQAQLVINEVDYDQESTDGAEYIEIFNASLGPSDLSNLSVVLYNNGVEYAVIEDATWPILIAGNTFTICGNAGNTPNCDHEASPGTNLLQNGPQDAIVLVWTENPTPLIMDALCYEGSLTGFGEGNGTTAEDTNDSPGVSIGRSPDGADSEDNDADFHLMCSTPGAPNIIDPVQCDLSTGIGRMAPLSTFTVLPAPGGGHLIVYDANRDAEPISFEVVDVDGSLLMAKAMGNAVRACWSFGTEPLRGRLLLVRITTPTRSETRRVVLP